MRRKLALLGATALLLITASSTLAATANTISRATLSAGDLHGGATLVVLANGHAATVAFKVHGLKVGSVPSATVTVGTCPATTASIVSLTGRATPASGVERVWVKLTKDQFATLHADMSAKDSFSITVTDGTASVCGTFSQVH